MIAQLKRPAATYIIGALFILVPLASTPVLPLIDFYNHLARYFVLSHVQSDPVLAANYAAAWALLPNLGLDAIATPLLALVPPLLAAKLIVALILLTQFGGVIFLHRALNRQKDVLPVILLMSLLYSYVLNWGFANFLLGLGLAFWNLGLWFRLRERLPLAVAVCSAGALVIFFCHGFAFALYGILLASLELSRWLDRPDRSVASLAGSVVPLGLQALLPAVIFLRMSTSAAEGASGSALAAFRRHNNAGSLMDRLDTEFWHRLEATFRVAESAWPMLDAATFIISLALIGLGLARGWFRLHRWSWLALAVLAVVFIFIPPTLFGVGYVADRLPLVFALLMVAALASNAPLPHGGRIVLYMLAVIALIRIGAITAGWSHYERHYAAFREVTATVPRGAVVADLLPTGADRRNGLLPRCQMYRPLLVVLNGAVAPLFANPTQQPLRLTGPLLAAQAAVGSEDSRARSRPGHYDDRLADFAAGSRFDYVIACGRDRLTRPLPPGVEVVAEKDDIALFRIR